jgi:hypothetical protein
MAHQMFGPPSKTGSTCSVSMRLMSGAAALSLAKPLLTKA